MPTLTSYFFPQNKKKIDGLSIYKQAVIKDIPVNSPIFKSIISLQHEHDFMFLLSIINNDLKLPQSRDRDLATIAAIHEFNKYLMSAVETFLFLSSTYQLTRGNPMHAGCIALCGFLVSYLREYTDSVLNSSNPERKVNQDMRNLLHTKFGDVVNNNLANLTPQKVIERSGKILSDVSSFIASNISYGQMLFSNKAVTNADEQKPTPERRYVR